jgi:hypothetical protein
LSHSSPRIRAAFDRGFAGSICNGWLTNVVKRFFKPSDFAADLLISGRIVVNAARSSSKIRATASVNKLVKGYLHVVAPTGVDPVTF